MRLRKMKTSYVSLAKSVTAVAIYDSQSTSNPFQTHLITEKVLMVISSQFRSTSNTGEVPAR
jgi:hypothetical protein